MSWFRWRAKEYHWTEVPNFGDAMAPLLLARFAGLKTEPSTISHARIVSVGSLLEHVPPGWDGYILGSGKRLEDSQLALHTRTAAILGLRGPLTARQCPPGSYAIGDPGLLVSELVPAQDRIYDLGIVPHWSDSALSARTEFRGRAWTVRVIDPRQPPLQVLTEIARCHRIVTSSLHGAIAADAFGIPRRIELAGIGRPGREGGTFKWRDYSASVGMVFEEGKMAEVNRLRVADRQYELFDAYNDLGTFVRNRGRR